MDLENDVRIAYKRDPRDALDLSKLWSYFRLFWANVHEIKCACVGKIAVCNTVFLFTISCFFLRRYS